MTTRYANLLIDAADTLSEARTDDAAWQAINVIARRIGANAVNAGAFLTGASQIAWMRSSMTTAWLDDYAGQSFHDNDPLIKGALAGALPVLYDVAARDRGGGTGGQYSDLHDGLMSHDYNYMISHSWFDGDINKGIVLSCRDDPTDLFGPGTMRAFSAVSAMMSYRLQAPDGSGPDGRAFGSSWRQLEENERDVVSYLAIGMSVDMIAHKLKENEATILRLIERASLKMNAETKDQTVALALTRGLLAI